ncbi:hypothetical protein FH972_022501 [Carpinus fangiana]|uniref:ER membrane protein complex subunit 7 beta-sandwich domain-containing protein n=1 Tax=Carpinus fangiana TaxID=176857 RepID=A0A5N6KSE6_9ROSI|nr:hypothetical protein FH972_022501 [Carpinus fangiana]
MPAGGASGVASSAFSFADKITRCSGHSAKQCDSCKKNGRGRVRQPLRTAANQQRALYAPGLQYHLTNFKVDAVGLKKMRASAFDGTEDDWDQVVRWALFGDPCSITKIEVVAQVTDSKLSIIIRQLLEGGITVRLGTLDLRRDDKLLDTIELYEWTGLAAQGTRQAKSTASILEAELHAARLENDRFKDQLQELIEAKQAHETQLLEKFRQLLNSKKLKIRDQQRLLAGAKIDAKAVARQTRPAHAVRSHRPGLSSRSKRKADAEDVEDNDGAEDDEGSDGIQVATPELSEVDSEDSDDHDELMPDAGKTQEAAAPDPPPRRDLPFASRSSSRLVSQPASSATPVAANVHDSVALSGCACAAGGRAGQTISGWRRSDPPIRSCKIPCFGPVEPLSCPLAKSILSLRQLRACSSYVASRLVRQTLVTTPPNHKRKLLCLKHIPLPAIRSQAMLPLARSQSGVEHASDHELDRIIERMRQHIPDLPYYLTVPSDYPYRILNPALQDQWRQDTWFEPQEEYLQYSTFVWRDSATSLFRLYPFPEEEIPQPAKPRVEAAPSPSGGPKKKMTLAAYKNKSKLSEAHTPNASQDQQPAPPSSRAGSLPPVKSATSTSVTETASNSKEESLVNETASFVDMGPHPKPRPAAAIPSSGASRERKKQMAGDLALPWLPNSVNEKRLDSLPPRLSPLLPEDSIHNIPSPGALQRHALSSLVESRSSPLQVTLSLPVKFSTNVGDTRGSKQSSTVTSRHEKASADARDGGERSSLVVKLQIPSWKRQKKRKAEDCSGDESDDAKRGRLVDRRLNGADCETPLRTIKDEVSSPTPLKHGATAAEWQAEAGRLSKLGKRSKVASTDTFKQSEDAAEAKEQTRLRKIAAVQGLESLLLFLQSFVAKAQSRPKPKQLIADWKSFLPYSSNVVALTRSFPHLEGLGLLLQSIASAQITAICTSIPIHEEDKEGSRELLLTLHKQVQYTEQRASEAGKRLPRVVLAEDYPKAYAISLTQPLGGGLQPMPAFRMAVQLLDEWSSHQDRVFVHALNTVKKIPRMGSARPPPAQRLRLYGLYKQSMDSQIADDDQPARSEASESDAQSRPRSRDKGGGGQGIIAPIVKYIKSAGGSAEDRWHKRIETALIKMNTEMAALREQLEMQQEAATSRSALLPGLERAASPTADWCLAIDVDKVQTGHGITPCGGVVVRVAYIHGSAGAVPHPTTSPRNSQRLHFHFDLHLPPFLPTIFFPPLPPRPLHPRYPDTKMHLPTLLSPALLAAAALAANLTLQLTPNALLPNPSTLPPSTAATLQRAGSTLRAPLSRANAFVFSHLAPGSYLLTVQSRDFAFAPLRVDVAAAAAAAEGGAERVDAWQTFWGHEWSNKGEHRGGSDQGSVVVGVSAERRKEYYAERAGLSLRLLCVEEETAANEWTVDDETRAEFEEMQAKSPISAATNPAGSLQNFDFAAWMSGRSDEGSSKKKS